MLLLLRNARRRALRKHQQQMQHGLRKWKMRCALWKSNTRKIERELNEWRRQWHHCAEYSDNLQMLCLKAIDTMIAFDIPVPTELTDVAEYSGVASYMLIQALPFMFYHTGGCVLLQCAAVSR